MTQPTTHDTLTLAVQDTSGAALITELTPALARTLLGMHLNIQVGTTGLPGQDTPASPTYAVRNTHPEWQTALESQRVFIHPGDLASFEARYGNVTGQTLLRNATWERGGHDLILSAEDERAEILTSEWLDGEALTACLKLFWPDDEGLPLDVRTRDGARIVGQVWTRPMYAPVRFAFGAASTPDSDEHHIGEAVIVSETDFSLTDEHGSQPWAPRNTSGHETPWLDDRGRLWATHDLVIRLSDQPEPTASGTPERP